MVHCAEGYLNMECPCLSWIRWGKSNDLKIWNKNQSRSEILKKQLIQTSQLHPKSGLDIWNQLVMGLAISNYLEFGYFSIGQKIK